MAKFNTQGMLVVTDDADFDAAETVAVVATTEGTQEGTQEDTADWQDEIAEIFGDDESADESAEGVAGLEPIPATVKEAVADIVDQTQIDQTKLTVRRLNWAQYMKAGVIAKITSKRFRGKGKLEVRDIGVSEVSDKFKLGTKVLLPRLLATSSFYEDGKSQTYAQVMDSNEKAARQALGNVALDTPFGKFVTVGHFKKWRETFARYQEVAYRLRDEMVQDWDLIVEAILEEYLEEANDAFVRHVKETGGVETTEDRALFVEAYIDRIDSMLPTAEQFYDAFVFEDSYEFIPLPTLLAGEMARAEQIIEEGELTRELSSAEAERLRAERIALRRTNDAEEAEINEMRRAVLASAKREAEAEAADFVDRMLIQVRQRVIDVAKAMNASFEKNGRIAGKNMASIRSMVDWIKDANVALQDEQVAAMMTEVQAKLDGQGEDDLLTVVNRVAGWCEVQIDGIERSGRANIVAEVAEVEADRSTGGRRSLEVGSTAGADVKRGGRKRLA